MENLYDLALHCFLLADPFDKMAATRDAVGLWQGGRVSWEEGDAVQHLTEPGRLSRPEIVIRAGLTQRKLDKLEGRAAMVHALAHIELTAVNLCWDAIYRYRAMPKAYYDDWVQVAGEEARHFLALCDRLREMGFAYGDFPVHDSLWQMALSTAGDLGHRMGIVHRVYEARSLDVVPKTIAKFERLGETALVKTLQMIGNEEIGHVGAGTRWFRYRCEQAGLPAEETFFALLGQYLKGPLLGPFNEAWRLQAGFTPSELHRLQALDPRDLTGSGGVVTVARNIQEPGKDNV